MRVEIKRRKFALAADIYDPKTRKAHKEEFLVSGKASMYTVEREFQKWCWRQGIVGRVLWIEDITDEAERMTRPTYLE